MSRSSTRLRLPVRGCWMRAMMVATVVAVSLSGCAAHHVQPQRIISTSWSTVRALPPGTDVSVALDSPANDEVSYGRVSEITDSALTIWERRGARLIPRLRVARLAVRTSIGTSRTSNAIKWSLVGAAIAGSLAWLASAMEENPHDS